MKGGKQAISLTEEMVYEMNRSGSTGYSGLDAAYHNYGLQGGDMESWKSDKYSQHIFAHIYNTYIVKVQPAGSLQARELKLERRRNRATGSRARPW